MGECDPARGTRRELLTVCNGLLMLQRVSGERGILESDKQLWQALAVGGDFGEKAKHDLETAFCRLLNEEN